MIPLELSWLVFTGLLVMLAGIVLVWIGYEILRRAREASIFRGKVRCALCAFLYAPETGVDLPACPQCGHKNERDSVKIY